MSKELVTVVQDTKHFNSLLKIVLQSKILNLEPEGWDQKTPEGQRR